jgi:L-lactate dehydrogenase complex protein LldG
LERRGVSALLGGVFFFRTTMSDDREAILSRVRGALAPLRERAPLPAYDTEIAVMRSLITGRDAAELFAERLKRVGGVAFFDGAALVAHLRANKWLRGYVDPALWPQVQAWFAGGDFTIEHDLDRKRVDDYAFGITRAAGAIAESGTIILNDATTAQRLGALAPWVHVAVVERAAIFGDVQQAVAGLGAPIGTSPSPRPSSASFERPIAPGAEGDPPS